MYQIPYRPNQDAQCDIDFRARIALGLTPITPVYMFGSNSDLDTTEDILCWPPGTAYTIPAAAAQVYVSSSNNSDTTQVVTVSYLDSTYTAQTATITLAGQTKTAVTGCTALRLQTATVSAACAGNVWLYFDDTVSSGVPQTAAKQFGYIPATYQATRQAIYTVPAGYYGLLMYASGTVGASATSKQYDLHVYKKTGTGAATLLSALTMDSAGTSVNRLDYLVPRLIPEKTDVYMKTENASADNTPVYCDGELWLIPTGKVSAT